MSEALQESPRSTTSSKRSRPHLSCLQTHQRARGFDLNQSTMYTLGNHGPHNNSSNDDRLPSSVNPKVSTPVNRYHSGSATTLDDASSINEHSLSVSPSKLGSPASVRSSNQHKSSSAGVSEVDITFGLSETSVNKSLATLTITNRESMYVRALFRYDPSTDRGLSARGLSFDHGDILYVINASDPEWWQARYAFPISPPAWDASRQDIDYNNHPQYPNSNSPNNVTLRKPQPPSSRRPSLGIVPSQRRMERRNRIHSKRVQFMDREVMIESQWNSFMTPTYSTGASTSYQQQHSRFFGSGGGGSSSSLSTSMYATTTPGAGGTYSNGDSMSIGGPCEREKKPSAFSIIKRFSSRRNRKAIEGQMKAKSISLEDVKDPGVSMSRTYEVVRPVTLTMARPLVLFGPLKEHLRDELMSTGDFAPCIQHTTRPPQINEREGVDFHFVDSKVAMQAELSSGKFLDAVVLNDHFFATSLQSVVDVLRTGKMCILDISIKSLYRLEAAGLHPISILLKPESVMQWRDLQRRLTVDQARRLYEASSQLESEYWYMLTAAVNIDSFTSAVNAVHRVLAQHRGPNVWLPASAQPLDSKLQLSS